MRPLDFKSPELTNTIGTRVKQQQWTWSRIEAIQCRSILCVRHRINTISQNNRRERERDEDENDFLLIIIKLIYNLKCLFFIIRRRTIENNIDSTTQIEQVLYTDHKRRADNRSISM